MLLSYNLPAASAETRVPSNVYVGPGGGTGFGGNCESPDFEDPDAGAALRDALDPAPDDGSTIYLCAGNYSITAAGANSFVFDPAAVGDSLTIQGEGRDLVFLDNPDEVYAPVVENSDGDLTLSDLTVTGGHHETGAGVTSAGHLALEGVKVISNESLSGGGILANPSSVPDELPVITISQSTFSGNSGSLAGGAIFSLGDISIETSTFVGNSSAAGAALVSTGDLSVINSTFSGNNYGADGPGVIFVDSSGTGSSILNSTIAANSITAGTTTEPLIGIDSSPVSLQNLLIEHSSVGPACGFDSPIDDGGNILALGGSASAGDCGAFTSSTVPGLKLGPLADNGGPTETMAIDPGSTAIDAGVSGAVVCPARDQRGVVRSTGRCDSGAFEYRDLEKPLLKQDGKPEDESLRVKTGCGNEFACKIRLTGVLVERQSQSGSKPAKTAVPNTLKALKGKTVSVLAGQVRPVRLFYSPKLLRLLYVPSATMAPLKVRITAEEIDGRQRTIVVEVAPLVQLPNPTG
jgi:hypothetical protein